MDLKLSSSQNHFLDTNVILRYANSNSSPYEKDIKTILAEAHAKKRYLWVSGVIFAEFRPSNFVPGVFQSVDDLAKYVQSIATVVSPDPIIMMRVARFRDVEWKKPNATLLEKPKRLTLGDAIHLATALHIKESRAVDDLEFLTWDNGKSATDELGKEAKALPLLDAQDYMGGLNGNRDANAICDLIRLRPILAQQTLA